MSNVSVIETHLSQLFLTPDRVFKLLKPVALPFVDFSSVERRCQGASVEFERNRLISPDVYLGTADVIENGVLSDRMIVMRRLPADRELTRLLHGDGLRERLRAVARHVAGMHGTAPPIHGERSQVASIDAVAQNWEDNFAAIAAHMPSVIDPSDYHEVVALARTYLAGRSALFQARMEAGWVRDGHGDLRCEHVYLLDDGPRLIDCVAFDDDLRVGDALADIAFLVMDLERLAGPEVAASMMHSWVEFTNEHHPSSLAHFYVASRAHVRAKIACLQHAAGQPHAADEARRYHRLALRHLRHARIRLILVGGGPGTGKSTVAEAVASRFGAVWLRADEIRKDLAGIGHEVHTFAEPGQGMYTPEMTERVHGEIRRQAELLLSRGFSVVIDSTWGFAPSRSVMRELASTSAAKLTELQCVLPASIARERITRRMASIYNPSDATPELVDYMADRFDDWPEAVPVETAAEVRDCIESACAAVADARPIDSGLHLEPPSVRFVVDLATLRDRILIQTGMASR